MYKQIINLKNSKLNRKLLRRLIAMFIFTIIYIVLITSNNIKALESARLNDINSLLVESYSKESNNVIDKAFETGDSLRKQIERLVLLDKIDYKSVTNIVDPVLLSQNGFKGIFVLLKKEYEILDPYWFKENGQIKVELVEGSDSANYWQAIENSDRGYIKPQIYEVDGENILLTTLLVPIKKDREVVGVIGMDLTLAFFQSLSNSLKSIAGMEVSIVSYDGMIIAHANTNLIGQSLYESDKDFEGLSVTEIIEYNSNETEDRHTLHTRFSMGTMDKQWHLLISIPKELSSTTSNATSIHILISGMFALTIIILLSAITVNRTLSPITELCDVLESAYNGNLSARTFINTGDEIENIGKGLNNLLASLEENKKELMTEVNVNKELNIELEELMKDNDRIYFDTIKSLVNTIEAKDLYTGGHCDRVTNYSLMIGRKIGLTRQELIILNYGAILHDIGKIGIPENILCKVDRLSSEEFELIKDHPKKGFEIVKDIHFLKDSSDIIIHHHERYDGHGYPDGLLGEDIDLLARIVAIADAYDAMTSSRSYRSALTREEAVGELIINKGRQFDPSLVDIFIDLLNNEIVIENKII